MTAAPARPHGRAADEGDVRRSVPGIGCAAVLWAGAAYTGLRAGHKA
ncbi:hypothetical protein [Streptomyces sp. NPDC059176]